MSFVLVFRTTFIKALKKVYKLILKKSKLYLQGQSDRNTGEYTRDPQLA